LDIGNGRTKEGLKFGDIFLYDSGSDYVAVRNRIDNAFLKLRASQLEATSYIGFLGTPGILRTLSGYNRSAQFNIYENDSWSPVASFHGEVVKGDGKHRFDVLECAMSNLPTSDPADGLSRIWSNGGVLTLGT